MTPHNPALRIPALPAILLVCFIAAPGCHALPNFPDRPIETTYHAGNALIAYDVNGDRRSDYWQQQQPGGRKVLLRFDDNRDRQPDLTVNLDQVPNDVAHLVIALDGVPFDLLHQLYQQGRFRLFHPPVRMISCFPSMTDLAYALMFDSGPCLGCEALYFDRSANQLSDGNDVYFSGANAPWTPNLAYRCNMWWDANAYLNPQAVFNHELRGIDRAFKRVTDGQAFAYTVATACLGTRGSRDAIIKYLKTVDRFCEQIVYRRRGRVKLTLLADHGHNLTHNKRISLKSHLRKAGFKPTKRLKKPNDVVVVQYGLVTYAALHTNHPAGVAQAVLHHPAVDLVAYVQGPDVVVRNATAQARIRKVGSSYRYDSAAGDPLHLAPVLNQLAADGYVNDDNLIDDRRLLRATAKHQYPDPLHRLWLAFHGLVKTPPDVLVSLHDGYAHGSKLFNFAIGGADSTHGSLNRINSTTFVMTMLGQLPTPLRPEDVLPALQRLRSAPSAMHDD